MKKGIIVTLAVTICMMLAATYAFAAPSKVEKKEVKKESTTTEKQKETTTAEKAKTETKESEVFDVEESESSTEEESDIEDTEEVSNNQEEVDDSEEDLDNEEIDWEKMDTCDHDWIDGSYAYDSEKGYIFTEYCKKCTLTKDTPISEEEYEANTQEPEEDNCEYIDDEDNVEIVE